MNTSGKIFDVLPKVAKAIGAIAKTRKNQQQGYQFRGIDDVMNAAHGPLCEHSVFVTTEVADVRREQRETKSGGNLTYTMLTLKVTFHADDGSSVTTTTAGEAMDSADKSTHKAMSAALKYAFFQTFTIPLDEQEADDVTHDVKGIGEALYERFYHEMTTAKCQSDLDHIPAELSKEDIKRVIGEERMGKLRVMFADKKKSLPV